MIPFLTALTGAAIVFAGALVARAATRYAAELEAAQRRRDAEIAHLAEFRNAVIDALTSFAIYRHSLARIPREDSKEATYEKAGLALEDVAGHAAFRTDTILQLERVRTLARGLMWEDLRAAFEQLETLLSPTQDLLGTAINLDENSHLIDSFVVLVANRQRDLIETYPGGRHT